MKNSDKVKPLNGHIKISGYIDLYITGGFTTTHVVVSVGHPITYLSPHPIPYQRESSLKISPCRQGFAVPEELGNKQTKNKQTNTLTH